MLLITVKIPGVILNYVYKLISINKIFLVSAFLLFIASINLIFSVHYFTLEQQSFIKSVFSSIKLIKGKTVRVMIIMMFCNIALGIGVFITYGLAIALIICILSIVKNSSLALVIFLSIFRIINLLIIFLIGVLAIPVNFIIISSLYYKYKGVYRSRDLSEVGGKVKINLSKRHLNVGLISIFIVSFTANVLYINEIMNNGFMNNIDILRTTQITAHRGSSKKAPENTLASIQYAIDDFSDYIEVDVQETKDGEIILLHDRNFKRVSGVNRNVWDTSYEEVSTLDVGSWFSKEFENERVPTLEEAIDIVKGKSKLNIEIKSNSRDKNSVESVVKIVQDKEFKNECIITSQSFEVLKKVKQIDEEIKTGYILRGVYGDFHDLNSIDLFSLEGNFVTRNMVDKIHKQNKEVHVWTMNTEKSIRRVVDMGVDNVITDDPILARKIIFSEDTTKEFNKLLNMLFR